MYFFSLTDIPAADEINTEINYSQEDKHITDNLTAKNILDGRRTNGQG